MEETDLALRLVDAGWTIRYDGTPAVVHPRTDPSRHPGAAGTDDAQPGLARLPQPAGAGRRRLRRQLVRRSPTLRQPRRLGDLLGGVRHGWSTRPRGQRNPIRGAPSPGSPGSADRRSCETGSVPTMTGAADGTDAPLAADERAALIAAHERRVEALRNSAQYRVGELVIAGVRSPRRLVRLPRRSVAPAQGAAGNAPRRSARGGNGPPGARHRRRHHPRRVLAPGASPRSGINVR